MAAEGLTRRAFPRHPQLWHVWSRDAGGTVEVAGRTAGGYLFVPLELALIALWAFVSYLQPAFSGELVRDVLRCN